MSGAKVIGFALPCEDGASGYEALGSADHMALEHIGDLARETLRWAPRLVGDAVFTETLNWYEAWLQGESMHLPFQGAVCRALAV